MKNIGIDINIAKKFLKNICIGRYIAKKIVKILVSVSILLRKFWKISILVSILLRTFWVKILDFYPLTSNHRILLWYFHDTLMKYWHFLVIGVFDVSLRNIDGLFEMI